MRPASRSMRSTSHAHGGAVGSLVGGFLLPLTRDDRPAHPRGMMSEALIYRTANRLIEQHGAKAMAEANRLLCRALERREQDRALIMLRVRLAVIALQAPRSGPLH